ncbi:MAG: aminoacyl-tRNA hydrolase [Spirochaetaceae bacterium]
MDRWLIVGLGNPGRRFDGTRHNVGFAVAERVSSLGGRRLRRPHLFGLLGPYRYARLLGVDVAEPLTYMNRSGDALPELLERSGVPRERLLVVTDNLDLPPGVTRMKRRGGSGTHNGLNSISRALGTDAYPRLYLGIGHPGRAEEVVGHVLSRPGPEERTLIDSAVGRASETLLRLSQIGFDQAMHELNRRE